MLKPVMAGVFLCFAAATALGQSRELSGSQITSLVAGATVEIDTPAGTKVPVRYDQEGRMSGEARDLAWYLGTATDRGRWWVAGDQLCHKWNRWFNSDPQCMRVSRDGPVVRWLAQDGNSGTATIVAPAMAQASAFPAFGSALTRRATEPPKNTAPQQPAAPPRAEVKPSAAPMAVVASLAPVPQASPADAPPIAPVAPPPVAETQSAVPASPPPAAVTKPSPPKAQETKAAPPPKPEPTKAVPKPAQPSLFRVSNVRRDDVLNVRSAPSPDADVVGELPPDSRGIAITSDCRARWCPVQHQATSGWVNSAFLAPEASVRDAAAVASVGPALRDSPEAPRSCLTAGARALLGRIEQMFGPVQTVSTCRPGAFIAGTGHPSRHASGNAVDFNAGSRKAAILEWLIANHRAGGTMTYPNLDHIHVDIGPHFVSIAGGRHWASWHQRRHGAPGRRVVKDDDGD